MGKQMSQSVIHRRVGSIDRVGDTAASWIIIAKKERLGEYPMLGKLGMQNSDVSDALGRFLLSFDVSAFYCRLVSGRELDCLLFLEC